MSAMSFGLSFSKLGGVEAKNSLKNLESADNLEEAIEYIIKFSNDIE